jgi:hypothetical protein
MGSCCYHSSSTLYLSVLPPLPLLVIPSSAASAPQLPCPASSCAAAWLRIRNSSLPSSCVTASTLSWCRVGCRGVPQVLRTQETRKRSAELWEARRGTKTRCSTALCRLCYYCLCAILPLHLRYVSSFPCHSGVSILSLPL